MLIKNTKHEAQHPWPEAMYVQGGDVGVVFRKAGGPYRTAFVEAFAPDTFLRGEGATVPEAEDDCWKKYLVWRDCSDGTGGHGPYERRQYRNGAGFCTKCGTWMNRVFDPLPEEHKEQAQLTRLEQLFGTERYPGGFDHLLSKQPTPDRLTYRQADWKRLGRAVASSRGAQRMTRGALGYAMRSSGKTVLRLEEGRVYGDPRTAPPGDYNSERYMLKRLPLLEMALEWEAGYATQILGDTTAPNVSPTA